MHFLKVFLTCITITSPSLALPILAKTWDPSSAPIEPIKQQEAVGLHATAPDKRLSCDDSAFPDETGNPDPNYDSVVKSFRASRSKLHGLSGSRHRLPDEQTLVSV